MKYIFFIFVCFSCVGIFHAKDSNPQHVPKEVPEMILISGMEYRGGNNCEGSTVIADLFAVYIGPFYISKHEITNTDFCCFLNEDSIRINVSFVKAIIAIGAEQNKITVEHGRYIPVKGFEQYPVVMVSWWGTQKYCQWLTTSLKNKNVKRNIYLASYRLPTEFEWVYATSPNKKQYDFIIPSCNETSDSLQQSGSPVRNIKKDSLGQYGIAGMNENVYEWTDDNFYTKKTVTDNSMNDYYNPVITPHALVRQYASAPLSQQGKGCGRISRLRNGFYSDVGFRIVQTSLGRSSGMEF